MDLVGFAKSSFVGSLPGVAALWLVELLLIGWAPATSVADGLDLVATEGITCPREFGKK